MCFKPKKPPPVRPDPEVYRQNAEARAAAVLDKSEAKKRRTEDTLAAMSGRFGRSSLLTGGAGGQGFAMPMARSLFAPNEALL